MSFIMSFMMLGHDVIMHTDCWIIIFIKADDQQFEICYGLQNLTNQGWIFCRNIVQKKAY